MEIKETTELDQVYHDALTVRKAVFVQEQGIDEALEFDGTDAGAIHFVAYEGGQPVATARATPTLTGVHIQRVATIREARHKGLAKQLVTRILTDPKFRATKRFYLGAQESATGFYQKLGFKVTGEPFIEVGIRHVNMEKEV